MRIRLSGHLVPVIISRITGIIFLGLAVVGFVSCKGKHMEKSDEELREMAKRICENNLIIDSHIDWPEFRMANPGDISQESGAGDCDLVRARKGGLDAALSVVFVSPELNVDQGRSMANSMIKMIKYYPQTYPDKFAIASNPADVRHNYEKNLFSLIPCLENGSPVGNDLSYLKYLKDQGIVYITLCHGKNNQVCDSNFETERKWNGLSPAGIEMIGEMNRLGIMVDISHSSDSTVCQALRYSRAPVVATHSACRHFVPGFERNLSDDLIKKIAEKNGVIMVNFCTQFLDAEINRNVDTIQKLLVSKGVRYDSGEGKALIQEFAGNHRLFTDSKALADHIEHVIKIAGIDYVGLGSDFDGIGPLKPSDIPDVSGYPVVVFELLKRGYSEKDIRKVLSGNFLRVWNEVVKKANTLNKGQAS